uniref:Integrin, alpha 5 (fibronectin receptor, alpha polypeptide) n=1 Tax=Cyprinus carpio TaxID=7962 RepID=A0A8C1J005_CYPCA
MGSKKHRSKTSASSRNPRCSPMGLSLLILLPLSVAFNLDVENPAVYTGPNGSYFGYSLDFYMSDSSVSIIVGAPKANTSQPNIREGGSVFYCPWSLSQSQCSSIEFDRQGNLNMTLNDTVHQGEFKSHQWFGATVRVHEDSVLACAPLYSWRAKEDIPLADTTGSCFLSVKNFTDFVEYAPCRTEFHEEKGQGYCQGGFSADFTQKGKVVLGGPGSYFWQGQVITAVKQEIVKAYYPGYFLTSVKGQMQTKQIKEIAIDDNYMGYSVAMGSYYGYVVAATDINNDGMTDLLVGAPMFMVRDSDGRLEELGRVYVYMQNGPLDLTPQIPHLTGTQMFARFGSSITPLGDLNQDGYNDVAISCPFGGENKQGLVLIYNGHAGGLREKPSQVIAGQWASTSALPASFGYALRGGKDLDNNGYPDLIVGAFGADAAVLYRSRPIVNTSATLTVYPTMINPEEKVCTISRGNETLHVSCVNLSFCLSANGKHLPNHLEFNVQVQLDRLKQQQKGAVRRALFLETQLPALQRTLTVPKGTKVCSDTKIYLRDEKDFRDKLSPIFVALNFSLNPQAAADRYGLRPILNYQTAELIEQKVHTSNFYVLFTFWFRRDRKEVYMGDDNSLTLTLNAKNDGGGAYEAELYVVLPPEADYSGIARNNEYCGIANIVDSFMRNCLHFCHFGGVCHFAFILNNLFYFQLWAGLRFTVPRLKDTHKFVQFDLQIRSKNENNSQSEVVPYKLEVVVRSDVILQGVSRPDKIFFPPPNWKLTKNVMVEQDVGPSVQHTYELVNNGPSRISHTLLQLKCPMRLQSNRFIYPVEVTTEGPVNCTTHNIVNPLNLKVRSCGLTAGQRFKHVDCWTLNCNVGLLERGTSAILHVRSRIWAETFMEVSRKPWCQQSKAVVSRLLLMVTPVVWNKPDSTYAVPLWIIILAILAGLLLLALLIYVLYKLGFFKRTPYGTAMEKAQLKPQAASEA